MKFNIVFSLPVHEHFEVVLDQILNITTLNPSCAIIIHESPVFDYANSLLSRESFCDNIIELKLDSCVFINPHRVRTGLYDIIQAHLANFKYAYELLQFDFFSMLSSNELFIKSGLYNNIKGYDCGLDKKHIFKGMPIDSKLKALDDDDLSTILDELNIKEVYSSQIEGSFYKKDIFKIIATIIENHYDYRQMKIKYAREEVYFSTILWALNKNGKYNVLFNGTFTFVPWNRKSLLVNMFDIKKYEKEDSGYFSVKRVDRNLADNIRAYIRQRYNYFAIEKKYLNVNRFSGIKFYFCDVRKMYGFYKSKFIHKDK